MQNNNRQYNRKKTHSAPKQKKYSEKDFKDLFNPSDLTTIKHDGCTITTNQKIQPLRAVFEASGSLVGILSELTLIQKFAIPAMVDGNDVLIKAPTGMGKTLCFLVHAMKRASARQGLSAIIVSPVRELAEQIKDEAKKISLRFGVRVDALYGKIYNRNIDYKKTNILIATPGKLLDYIDNKRICLDQVGLFVLDEADQLLDMGFDEDIKRIYNSVPSNAQVCLFSATYNNKLYTILQMFLTNKRTLVEVNVDIPVNISQEVLYPFDKNEKLLEILKSGKYCLKTSWFEAKENDKVLIFVQRKSTTKLLEDFLGKHGISCISYHGDKDQRDRNSILERFKTGKCPVLIATSVAARGIDVKDVKLVINYDLPNDIKEYIHRIGRTGREGKHGESILFYDKSASPQLKRELVSLLKTTNNPVPEFLFGNKGPTKDFVATEADGELVNSDEEMIGMW